MSSPIWTPAALSSEARPYAAACWRLVEAQHRVSTLKLVDDLDDQFLLEKLIDDTKPALPPECRNLDYLLATPFRYGAVYPYGSRFRRAGLTPGVWYGAERPETAVAELAFYRLLFFAESPGTPWPNDAAEYTAFSADIRTELGIDLTAPPLDRDSEAWRHPTNYAPCQSLADAARAACVTVIRYASVRDPGRGTNVAVLTCAAFATAHPTDRRTWRMKLGPTGIQAICEFPDVRLGFGRDAFALDPRLSAFDWDRPRR
jgi:hypothetical protein